MPSFDAPDIQLKAGGPLQGRVVGRSQTNCCLMVSFDRDISAETDTVKSGALPPRDGKLPGLDKGTKARRALPPSPSPRLLLARTSHASRTRLARISHASRPPPASRLDHAQVYVRVGALDLKKVVAQGGYNITAGAPPPSPVLRRHHCPRHLHTLVSATPRQAAARTRCSSRWCAPPARRSPWCRRTS